MAQVKLVLVALAALLAVSLAVPAKYRRDDGHAVSDSSSDSSDSSDSSSSESGEEHNRKRQPARNVPVSNPQDPQDQQEEQYAGLAMGNAIPFEPKESEVVPPYPKPVRRSHADKGAVLDQKMEPGQPWESHYKHGVAPAKLPAQETDNAHSYRHSIIHPYGDDLHA
ncbi:uncharacterized protein LOC117652141 [Thrips palmi]|uniref:Uncharacterized protein LOC117652141 n=1 Tax=Thrips palmi TaxID=161013 RepID=A0A6P9A644_THRPL|nr:uncharacterized protein LOC117652141 [Thrips palmi]